ncbi:hypothetical protein DFR43_11431 [Tepidicella xavieri]|uniref:Uncharacterized protein n=1 Tax=Tepidicella xavieri TaxID=360241 RepID=A0A4R6U5C7_9BURK|nr:hypothetical protein DFR43_11431 [Tepidicella xavieri]
MKDTIAAKINAARGRPYPALWVDAQTKRGKLQRNAPQQATGGILATNDGHHVVHVAYVVAHAKVILDFVIDDIEQDIGGQLAGQRTNWQTDAAKAIAAIHRTQQGKNAIIAHDARHLTQQHIVVDAGEVALDIDLDDIRPRPRAHRAAQKRLRATHGSVRAFAAPACVAVVDEAALEQWLDNAHDGVVNDAVWKRRRGDFTPLRVAHPKTPCLSGLPCAAQQVFVDVDQVGECVCIESGHFLRLPLAFARFAVGGHEVVPRHDTLE